MRGLLRRALERGELADDALIRFPQLLVAPGIIAIFWSGLFDRFEPLDARAMMRANLDLPVRQRGGRHDGPLGAPPPRFACLRCCLRPATPPPTSIRAGSRPISFSLAPEDVGRVQTLSVREGDTVKTGEPLFTVDDELQQADLAQVKALADQRATNLRSCQRCCSRPVPARKRTSMPPRRCCATRRRDSTRSQTRLARRTVFSPVSGTRAGSLLPTVAKWSPPTVRCWPCCRPAISKCASSCLEAALPNFSLWRHDQDRLRRLRRMILPRA